MSVRPPAGAVWIQMSPNRRRLRHRNGDTRHRGQSLQPIRNTNVVGAVWRCWRVSGGLMGWRGMSGRWVLLPAGCGMPMTGVMTGVCERLLWCDWLRLELVHNVHRTERPPAQAGGRLITFPCVQELAVNITKTLLFT